MEALLLALGMIILFFVLFLIIKSISKKSFCVLCAAVSLTWLLLLVLSWRLKIFDDILLIALLLGGSIVGMLYFLEKKVAEKKMPEKYLLFRLPLYLTMVSGAYFVLNRTVIGIIIIPLLILWLLFILIFLYQHNYRIRALAEKIITCCKNW